MGARRVINKIQSIINTCLHLGSWEVRENIFLGSLEKRESCNHTGKLQELLFGFSLQHHKAKQSDLYMITKVILDDNDRKNKKASHLDRTT